MSVELRDQVSQIVKGLDRYNPENVEILQRYVKLSATENFYDLEAYLAVLKLYQFCPKLFNPDIVLLIFLKAITNLPHSDFIMCKGIIDLNKLPQLMLEPFAKIMDLADSLETCHFEYFWKNLDIISDRTLSIKGFEDSIRKFVCHVVGITYRVIKKSDLKVYLGDITESQVNQWISTNRWKDKGDGYVFIAPQENTITTRNVAEKLTIDGVSPIMTMS